MLALDLIKTIKENFKKNGIESAEFEAKQIVLSVCDSIVSTVSSKDEEKCIQLAQKRVAGYPLQYLLGEWEFYSLPFFVGEGVLIPRADTETVVDQALKIIKQNSYKTVLDLCSGSGCIAIAVKKNADVEVTAVEASADAFCYLVKNAERNKAQIGCVMGDALKYKGKKFDLVISNPPYIKTEVIKTLSEEVKKEPKMALDGGKDGLLFYRKITENAKQLLNKNGTLLFEIGFDQEAEVLEILKSNGFLNVRCVKDLNSQPRAIFGTLGDIK